ncbi:unnamed protein product [Moneuplotes crassus]|uniref:Glutaredoxin domain-containing protein n=1 Tax=Euplotes crassus TaxID=5936 RepID=A0AAD1Y2M5_EUPCR|nr:unnamed protein product [Moneuplotes crassus]
MFGNPSTISKAALAQVKVVKSHIQEYPMLMYVKSTCPYCKKAKELMEKGQVDYKKFVLDQLEEGRFIKEALVEITGQRTVPNIFIAGKHIGGFSDINELHEKNELKPKLDAANVKNIF